MARRVVQLLLLTAVCAATGCAWSPSRLFAGATGTLRGRILPADAGLPGDSTPQVVVYLEPLDPGWRRRSPPATAILRQGEDESWPALLTVAAGDRVEFLSGDEVHHQIFSYSEPNAFQLELQGAGDAALVVLRHAGVVRFYCSLHPWENGVILVAPSHYFDTTAVSKRYEIRGVPRGRYRLHTWSELVASVERTVVVSAGESRSVDIAVHVAGDS